MILVPVIVLPSSIHGHGLFASRRIQRGETVTIWSPETDIACRPEDIEMLEPEARARCRHFGYVGYDGVFRLSLGPERFINHSGEPNLGGDPAVRRIALRDVEAGEELVEDYARHGVDS